MCLYGSLWVPVGPYGSLWGTEVCLWGREAVGALSPEERDARTVFCSHGSLWVPMGPIVFLWVPVGPYGSLWVPMGRCGALRCRCGAGRRWGR